MENIRQSGNRGGEASTSGNRQRFAFPAAAHPDIVRAQQKDEAYLAYLSDACQDVVRRVLGPRTALLWSRETSLMAELLYHSITTGSGIQTLGEEYCDILQVSGPSGTSPAAVWRGALILLETVGPYLAERLHLPTTDADGYDREPMENDDMFGHRVGDSSILSAYRERGRELVHKYTRRWREVLKVMAMYMPWLVRLHLALFYFYGVYYQWSKRATGTRYIFLGKIFERRPSYHFLGLLLFLQLGISAGSWGLSQLAAWPVSAQGTSNAPVNAAALPGRSRPSKPAVVLKDDSDEEAEAKVVQQRPNAQAAQYKCPLCLSPRTVPTATPCGHVFCWECIAAWCNQKPECPLCRSSFTTSGLVCVYHADF